MNVVMDKKCYRSILNYTPGKQAIERARNNVASKFNQSKSVEPCHVGICNDCASIHFQSEIDNDASCQETEIQGNTSYNPSTIEFIFICRWTAPVQIHSIREYSKSRG